MNKLQTVYIPIETTEEFWKKFDSGEIPHYEIISCSNGERLDEWVDSKEGYFFTPEELKQLLSDAIKHGLNSFEDFDAESNYDEESRKEGLKEIQKEYIENFLNKEK